MPAYIVLCKLYKALVKCMDNNQLKWMIYCYCADKRTVCTRVRRKERLIEILLPG